MEKWAKVNENLCWGQERIIFMFKKKENLIGLDIGSHSVKIAHVDTRSTPARLVTMGMIPLPREAFAEGRVTKSEVVARCIKQLFDHLKLKEKAVAASVSGYEVMIKKIELPQMTEQELRKRMQSELGQYIPFNIDEVHVDYQVLDIAPERANQMEVLLVAAKKESVNDHVNLLKLARLDPLVIDVDYFALSNAYETSFGTEKTKIALVDIGANKAIMDIIHEGVPIFTRGIAIGGSSLTEAIRDTFQITDEEAERVKLGEITPRFAVQDVQEVFLTVVRDWAREIRRAIDFYYNNFPENKLDKLYLCGGSSRIPGLHKILQENLSLEVLMFNPLERLEKNPKLFDPAYMDYIGPQMAISLGLALRKAKEK